MRTPLTLVLVMCATLYGQTLSAQGPEPEWRTTLGIGGRLGGFYAFEDPGVSARLWTGPIGFGVTYGNHTPRGSGLRRLTSNPGVEFTATGHFALAGWRSRNSVFVRPYLAGGALYVTRGDASFEGGLSISEGSPGWSGLFGGGAEIVLKKVAVGGELLLARSDDVVATSLRVVAHLYLP